MKNAPKNLEYPEFFRPGLGTENVAPFLRAFVQMVRPSRILEVGAGYTTPFFLEALYNNQRVFNDGNLNQNFLSTEKYDPKLVIIDDLSLGEITTNHHMKSVMSSDYVKFVHGVFQGKAQKLKEDYGLFDFVWFDCGSAKEYAEFLDEYWSICNGYIIFHYTYSDGRPNKNMEVLEKFLDDGFPVFSIVEPHKKRQGSISIVKKQKI